MTGARNVRHLTDGSRQEPSVSAVVLAGGRSSRMGRDKASLEFGGRSLLQRSVAALEQAAREVVVVRAPGQPLPAVETTADLRVVEDPVEGEGPLVGIAAGLEAASGAVALIVAVDMPFLEPTLLRLLAAGVAGEHRWVVPVEDGRAHPLCSAMATDALPVVRAHLDAGDRAPMALADDLRAYRMERAEWSRVDPAGRSFLNVNTPEEFEAAQQLLAR